jgi:hypothetical protein
MQKEKAFKRKYDPVFPFKEKAFKRKYRIISTKAKTFMKKLLQLLEKMIPFAGESEKLCWPAGKPRQSFRIFWKKVKFSKIFNLK